jgi:hypothetical protein
MRTLRKCLLAATAVLALAPSAALAHLTCGQVCTATSSCHQACYLSPRELITCGEFGYCGDLREEPTQVTAATSDPKANQSDAQAQVCSEEQHAAETTAES